MVTHYEALLTQALLQIAEDGGVDLVTLADASEAGFNPDTLIADAQKMASALFPLKS